MDLRESRIQCVFNTVKANRCVRPALLWSSAHLMAIKSTNYVHCTMKCHKWVLMTITLDALHHHYICNNQGLQSAERVHMSYSQFVPFKGRQFMRAAHLTMQVMEFNVGFRIHGFHFAHYQGIVGCPPSGQCQQRLHNCRHTAPVAAPPQLPLQTPLLAQSQQQQQGPCPQLRRLLPTPLPSW